MSEPGPESIPTSTSKTSRRPLKKRPLTALGTHASQIDALFANPDKPVTLPDASYKNPKTLAPPPEIVANVQGSSAGAGSGEFHVYKASRRREYERIRMMDEEVAKEEAERDWEGRQLEMRKRDDAKTGRNKARREKAKARKEKAKHGGDGQQGGLKVENKGVARPMKARPRVDKEEEEEEEEEEEGVVAEHAPAEIVEEVGLVIHDDD
jgi:hypothetical protein